MKKVILILIISCLSIGNNHLFAEASLVSDSKYRYEQKKEFNQELKQIKKMLESHNSYSNKHDLQAITPFYTDDYVNSDGFTKEVYLKSVKETWDECKDITYNTKILSVNINGDYALVNVEETATGSIFDSIDLGDIAGEIHSKSTGIYHLRKVNGIWLISSETVLNDESSLLYGDARFMNIELQAPSQIGAGEEYTTTLKIQAPDKSFIIASIDRDPVVYPSEIPNPPMRAMPQNNTLERILKANNDNIAEYAVASLAVSKAQDSELGDYKVYLSGLACLMKRVNVVPKNNFIKIEEE